LGTAHYAFVAGENERMDDASMRERADKLRLDQLALALRNLGPNHFLMPMFAAIIAVMYHRWVSMARLETWFAILTVSVIPLGLVSHRFRRGTPDAARAGTWIHRATLAYLLFACGWASMVVFLWSPHDDLNNLIIVLLLACTVAGNGALVGSSRPMAVVVFAVYGSALVIAPLRTGGLIYNGIAAMAVIFVAYLAWMSMQIYRTARDMLMLRNDKSDLIVALAQAKTESDIACERAEAASRAKSQFLANMSHELRTPLNAILGFSELICVRTFGDIEKHYEYAGLIHGSGQHLLTLINDVLDLAKIEAGGFELRESDVDLARLIGDAATLMAPRAQSGGCVLETTVAPSLPLAYADERALKQIALNLLSNAIKFTPGGAVEIFANVDPKGGIVFGVADNGIGIAREDQARIFENFGQGRHDVAINDKGTGLGLPIALGLVRAHGGRIALESELGQGTRVSVHLPAGRTRVKLRAAS
jgi:two-component system, cell cycle sensor histidine kinase PleC